MHICTCIRAAYICVLVLKGLCGRDPHRRGESEHLLKQVDCERVGTVVEAGQGDLGEGEGEGGGVRVRVWVKGVGVGEGEGESMDESGE